MRWVVFNADDYGLSPAVSRGIIAARHGVVRSTSVLANLVTKAELLALGEADMSVGIHLNLSTGTPLTPDYPAGLLDPSGRFSKAHALDPTTWESAFNRNAALQEWMAQFDWLDTIGVQLDHIDSHHHIHLMDPLFDLALGLAHRAGLRLRVRDSQAPLVSSSNITCPDELVEGYFGINGIGREQLLDCLAATSGAVVEVVCHPGYLDKTLSERSDYQMERATELGVLGNPELADELRELGWIIGGYNW